jgi:hypothetical protein
MPDPKTETTFYKFGGEWDGKSIDAGVKRSYGLMTKATKIATRGMGFLNKAVGSTAAALKKRMEVSKRLARSDETRLEKLLTYTKKAERLEQDLLFADEADEAEIRKSQAALEKKYKQSISQANDYSRILVEVQKASKKLNDEEKNRKFEEAGEIAGTSLKTTGKDLADSFADGLDSLRSKDLASFAKMFVKEVGHFGKGLKGFGMRTQAKGAEMGGGMGKIVGVIGKIADTTGGLLKFLSTAGPLLTAIGGAMAAVVKLFLDADAAAKNFNKEILATSGTTGFLTDNMGNTAAAAADLETTLGQIYDSATDIKKNWDWGINKEQHAAVINALTAEGVRIESLKKGFDAVGKGATESAGYVKDWGTMVQMSVAYSRAFGVTLGELTQFQGEMMTEMGASFDEVEKQFGAISKGAEESGIEANKFFGILRAVSSDLALYNVRMEDATHLLTLLGKTMNPRNAAKFMQTAMQALKGMTRIDRLKLNLLGGGQMAGMVTKDLGRKAGSLAKQIASAGGKQNITPADLLDSSKSMESILEGVTKEQQGTFREALIEMRSDAKMNKKGTYGAALAGRNLGPGAAIDALKSALLKFAPKGTKSLAEARGNIGTEQMAENLGISEEQLESMVKVEASLDEQKDLLHAQLKKGGADADKAREALKKAHIDESKLDAAGAADIMETMDDADQEAIKNANKQIDWQKETAGLQSSIIGRLDTIIDWLMNQLNHVLTSLADAVMGIWDSLPTSWVGEGKQARKLAKMEIEAAKTRDKRVIAAIEKSGGDKEKARGDMAGTVGKDLMDNLDKLGKQWADLSKAASTEKDPKKKAALQKQMQEVEDKKKKETAHIWDTMSKEQKARALADAAAATKNAKLSDKAKQIAAPGSDTSMEGALGDLSSDEINAVLGKSVWAMTYDQLLKVAPGIAGSGGGGGSGSAQASTTAAPASAAQAELERVKKLTAAPSSAAQAAAAPSSQKPVTPDDIKKSTEEQGQNVRDANDKLRVELGKQSAGIVLKGSYLKNQYGGQIEDSVYSATSRALFEYYLLQSAGQEEVTKAIQRGVNYRDIQQGILPALQKGMDATNAVKGMQAGANADGGVVGRPAPGEFFASVKPGETIVPEGGGGGGTTKVVLELKGDMLKQIMRATALNTINEHDRAKTNR